jgi:hypothetical protein
MLLIGDEPWKVDLTAWFQNDGEIHVALLQSPLTLPPPEEGLRTMRTIRSKLYQLLPPRLNLPREYIQSPEKVSGR